MVLPRMRDMVAQPLFKHRLNARRFRPLHDSTLSEAQAQAMLWQIFSSNVRMVLLAALSLEPCAALLAESQKPKAESLFRPANAFHFGRGRRGRG